MAGHAAGACGCVLPVDVSLDGITLVYASGCHCTAAGVPLTASDHTFADLRISFPKIVSFGQALEMAKAWNAKLAIELHHPLAAAQARISLKYSDYLRDAYFCGLPFPAACALAIQYPDIQVMADLSDVPEDPIAFAREAQNRGLFGLRGPAWTLSEPLCTEALRCGLFLAVADPNDVEALRCMIARGVNFIETPRPDRTLSLLRGQMYANSQQQTY